MLTDETFFFRFVLKASPLTLLTSELHKNFIKILLGKNLTLRKKFVEICLKGKPPEHAKDGAFK